MRDYYGRIRPAQTLDHVDAPKAYDEVVETSGDNTVTYTRFFETGDEACAIWKVTVTKTGSTITGRKHEWAFAKWADRLTADYVPINDCWNMR